MNLPRAHDASLEENLSHKVEFPARIILRRDGLPEIIHTHLLPTSIPDIKCHTTKNYGKGVYTYSFVYADGVEKPLHRKLYVEDDRLCPFIGHCS